MKTKRKNTEQEDYDHLRWAIIRYPDQNRADCMMHESIPCTPDTRASAREWLRWHRKIWPHSVFYILHYGERVR